MIDNDLDRRLRAGATRLASRPLSDELRSRLLAVPADAARARPGRGREAIAVFAVATALAVVLVAALAGHRSATPTPPAAPPWHEVLRVQVNGGPNGALAAGGGSAWLTTRGHTRLYRVDGASHLVTLLATPNTQLNSTALPSAASALLATPDSIWVATENRLLRLDRSSGRQLAALPVSGVAGDGPGLVVLAGDIWAAEGDSGAVVRIDPESAQVRATIPVRSSAPPPDAGRDPAALAASDNMLWVLSGDGWSVAGIDPRSNQVTRSFLLPHQADDIAAAAGSLWLTSPASNVLDRVDPANGTLQASIAVQQPTGLAATNASVWVGSATRVLRIDTQRDRVADRLDLGGQVFALAADGENVWAAEGQEPSVSWITRG